MSASNGQESVDAPRAATWPVPPAVYKRVAIWTLFLAGVYLISSFFFVAFMTFMFSYMTLAVVNAAMARLSARHERTWLRRSLVVALFILAPLVFLALGGFIASRLVSEGQHLVGWLSRVDPEAEVTRLLEGYVGPNEFQKEYGGPGDARYQKAFDEFKESGVRHVAEYDAFPALQDWVEGGFSRRFEDETRSRIRTHLAQEGTLSRPFEQWFRDVKLKQLKEAAEKRSAAKEGAPATPDSSLMQAAVTQDAAHVLEQVRRDAEALKQLRHEWLQDTTVRGLAAAKLSQEYQKRFREFYESRREQLPGTIPYTYEEYAELKKARPMGAEAFGEALDRLRPNEEQESPAKLRADFEESKRHELFKKWWSTSSAGQTVQRHMGDRLGAASAAASTWLGSAVSSLIDIPLKLVTAMILSFFICIDFPNLRSGVRRLRETWLRDAYDEIVPALYRLAHLIGRAMYAQGMIAACNAAMMFLALTVIGVEHAALLSLTVFVFCLVPIVGMILSWVPILTIALVQPGGGFGLALKATGAIVFVLFMENFVFSPKIFGKMMELHPVLIIALLPVAEYFFGIWGVILATPVAVYIIHEFILRKHLIEIDADPPDQLDGPPPRPAESKLKEVPVRSSMP